MRSYTANLAGQALTAAPTAIVEVTAHTNRSLIVTRASLSQQGNTTSAQQGVQMARQSTAGTNVTSPTLQPNDSDDAAAGLTARGLCTVLGTLGNVLYPDSFNWQNGWLYLPVPEERIAVPGAGILALRTTTTPPAQTINATLAVLEIG